MSKIHNGRRVVNLLETERDDKPRQGPAGLVQMEFAFVLAGFEPSTDSELSLQAEENNQNKNPIGGVAVQLGKPIQ